MSEYVWLELKGEVLERWQLPRISYPVAVDSVAEVLDPDGELAWSALLHGLQVASERGKGEWQSWEPAMARLTALIAPGESPRATTAAGDSWWLEIGPVDLDGRIVTIQRESSLIAAVAPREDGRLRVATFRPLDGKSASYLIGLGRRPHPEGGVCLRENNWEYALDCSSGNGNLYAFAAGAAHLSYWESGLGNERDGSVNVAWRQQIQQPTRPVNQVAMEIGTYFSFSQTDEIE